MNCAVCKETIVRAVERHWKGWLDGDGDQLSYVPTLHDHTPEPRTCVDCDDEFVPTRERDIRCVSCNVVKHFG